MEGVGEMNYLAQFDNLYDNLMDTVSDLNKEAPAADDLYAKGEIDAALEVMTWTGKAQKLQEKYLQIKPPEAFKRLHRVIGDAVKTFAAAAVSTVKAVDDHDEEAMTKAENYTKELERALKKLHLEIIITRKKAGVR